MITKAMLVRREQMRKMKLRTPMKRRKKAKEEVKPTVSRPMWVVVSLVFLVLSFGVGMDVVRPCRLKTEIIPTCCCGLASWGIRPISGVERLKCCGECQPKSAERCEDHKGKRVAEEELK